MDPMIRVDGLGRKFGDFVAVDNISFDVGRGEVLGFLGPNGAGKSTTMKMLTCFLTPSMGSAQVNGYCVEQESRKVRASVGYLPENAPLYGEMSVQAFLRFAAEVRGLSDIPRAIDRATELCDLGAVFSQRVETLSKGFKRRVGLAQAILHDPDILILDEPTDGLDPNQKHEVRSLIASMPDKCILLSTHILEEVDAVCSRAIIISAGKIVADDTPLGLKKRTAQYGAVQLRLASEEGAVKALSALQKDSGVKAERLVEQGLREVDGVLISVQSAKASEQQSSGDGFLKRVLGLVERENISPIEVGVNTGQLDSVFRDITT